MVYVVSKLLAIPADLDNRSIDCNHICLDMINLHIIVFSSVSSVVRAAGWLAGAAAPTVARAEASRPAGRVGQPNGININYPTSDKKEHEDRISIYRRTWDISGPVHYTTGGGGWSTINLHSAFNKSVHILQ